MRIVHIDNYEVCEENGKFLAASFVALIIVYKIYKLLSVNYKEEEKCRF